MTRRYRESLVFAGLGTLIAALLILWNPQAALTGWRVAFIVIGGIPIGAVALLLIARLSGADWNAALLPLTPPLPWLWLAALPVVVAQALQVPFPSRLQLWLSPPFFACRSAAAIGLWCWLARALRRGTLSEAGAAAGLVAHGLAVTLMASDWLLGLRPGQPNTGAGMALAVLQILGACAAACLMGNGPARTRRDLGHLLIATCMALAYLLFIDFLVVWYGNQPGRVGWYLVVGALPWTILAPLALMVGVFAPIIAIALGRNRALPLAGTGALLGAGLALAGEAALGLAGLAVLLVAGLALAGAVWRERRA